MRCPLCKERVKWRAVKCRFCGTVVDRKTEEIQFIKNGFDKIEAECNNLEKKVLMRCGFIIRWHMFSEEELFACIEKIENFARKIRSDIENWNETKSPVKRLKFFNNESVKLFFNENARRLQDRLCGIQDMIQIRHPTIWERIGSAFKAFYFHLVERLLPLIGGSIGLGFKNRNRIPAEV